VLKNHGVWPTPDELSLSALESLEALLLEVAPEKMAGLLCQICYLPVPLETSKTDAEGRAVHEECYAAKLGAKKPPSRSRTLKPW
jgi:hypothetical protein